MPYDGKRWVWDERGEVIKLAHKAARSIFTEATHERDAEKQKQIAKWALTEEVAKTFSVSVPTIKRWLKRRRETGDVQPRPIPGRPRLKGAALEEWLPSQLQHNNDLTLEEHREAFEEEVGVVVSASTVSRTIARLPQGPWPIKKSHS